MISKFIRLVFLVALAVVGVHAYRERKSHGVYYGVPFDFRVPTPNRVMARMWNPDDSRVITPTVFGVGWSVNLYQAGRDMGFIQPEGNESRG